MSGPFSTAVPPASYYVTKVVLPGEKAPESHDIPNATWRVADNGCLLVGNDDASYAFAPGEWLMCSTIRQNG